MADVSLLNFSPVGIWGWVGLSTRVSRMQWTLMSRVIQVRQSATRSLHSRFQWNAFSSATLRHHMWRQSPSLLPITHASSSSSSSPSSRSPLASSLTRSVFHSELSATEVFWHSGALQIGLLLSDYYYYYYYLRRGSSANHFLHRPFPFLPDWFHRLSDHLMFLSCSTAGFVCMVC